VTSFLCLCRACLSRQSRLELCGSLNDARWQSPALYGKHLRDLVAVHHTGALSVIADASEPSKCLLYTKALRGAVRTAEERFAAMTDVVRHYVVAVPPVTAACPVMVAPVMRQPSPTDVAACASHVSTYTAATAHIGEAIVRMQVSFPDKWLVQYDCGKLQVRLT
jgi:hypothetical protein